MLATISDSQFVFLKSPVTVNWIYVAEQKQKIEDLIKFHSQ